MVSAICPNCHIILVEASNNEDSRLAAAENEAATLGATEISNSFASAAPSEAQEYAKAYDHPGISITAAGGDHGYGVESPASDPHVIAVGGTTLVPASNRRGWTETVWYESIAGEVHGTGSGCSTEPKPAWQTDIGCRTARPTTWPRSQTRTLPCRCTTATNRQRLRGGCWGAPVSRHRSSPPRWRWRTRTRDRSKAPWSLYWRRRSAAAARSMMSCPGATETARTIFAKRGPGYDGPTGLRESVGRTGSPTADGCDRSGDGDRADRGDSRTPR